MECGQRHFTHFKVRAQGCKNVEKVRLQIVRFTTRKNQNVCRQFLLPHYILVKGRSRHWKCGNSACDLIYDEPCSQYVSIDKAWNWSAVGAWGGRQGTQLQWLQHSSFFFFATCVVCVSICLSRSWIMSKRINISSKFFHHWVATPFLFFRTKRGGDNPTGTPLTGASNARGCEKIDDFRPISRCISQTVIVRWAHAARQFVSIEFSFHPYNTSCGLNNWETVEDRWVHAARQFVSIEFSFHPYNI